MHRDFGHWTYRQLRTGEYEVIDPAGAQAALVAMPSTAQRPSVTMLALTRTYARLHGGTVSIGGELDTDDVLDVLIFELDAGTDLVAKAA